MVGRALLKPTLAPPTVPIDTPGAFTIRIFANPTIIDNDSANFEVTYQNLSSQIVRFDAKFLIEDPQGQVRIDQEQSVEIPPGGSTIIFWDSGDLLTLSNMPGNWTATFQAFDRFDRIFTAQETSIIFPVTL